MFAKDELKMVMQFTLRLRCKIMKFIYITKINYKNI
jgi:hypothetical protein